MPSTGDNQNTETSGRGWTALLALPFIALLWVPFYNRIEPSVWGIPFFYWYQFLWVILTTLIILFVHARTQPRTGSERGRNGRPQP